MLGLMHMATGQAAAAAAHTYYIHIHTLSQDSPGYGAKYPRHVASKISLLPSPPSIQEEMAVAVIV